MTLPIRNPSLYEGMSLSQIIHERKATLEQLRLFHRQRPSILKQLEIEKVTEEIRALLALKGTELS